MARVTQDGPALTLSAQELETLRDRLLQERIRLLEMIRRDQKVGRGSVQEASEDLVDQANLAYNRELTFSLSDAERQQLHLIDEALVRFEEGTYGICKHSGLPIGPERLRVVPWAKYRVEFQEMIEQGLLMETD